MSQTQDVGDHNALANDPVTDEAVVARVIAGDCAAFATLMRRYNQRLFRIIRGILPCDDEAEDVLQETYLRAFQHLRQFAGRARFSTWLTRIAVHEALHRAKQRQRLRPVDFGNAAYAALLASGKQEGAEQVASNHELRQILERAIDDLPLELRAVFTLRMIEGADTSAVADYLQLTEANIKVRLHRARTKLRASIDAELGGEVRALFEFGGARCNRVVQAVLRRVQASSS